MRDGKTLHVAQGNWRDGKGRENERTVDIIYRRMIYSWEQQKKRQQAEDGSLTENIVGSLFRCRIAAVLSSIIRGQLEGAPLGGVLTVACSK
jgi:hypothetical protein